MRTESSIKKNEAATPEPAAAPLRVVNAESLCGTEFPTTIWVVPTTRCNTKCRTCLHFTSDFGQDMPPHIFEKVQAQVLRKVSRVNLVGLGEPLVAKNFQMLLDTCLEHGVRVFFITNGKAFTPELMEKCIRSGAEVMISIDGMSQETFGHVRPYLKLSQVLDAFAKVQELREKGGNCTFRLLSNTVVMRRNLPELPEIVQFLVERGVDSISLTDLIPHVVEGHAPDLAAETPNNYPEELGRAFREAMTYAKASGTRVAFPPYYHRLAFPEVSGESPQAEASPREIDSREYIFPQRCYMPWTHANILVTGEVTSCCGSGRILGSLETTDFDGIWNGPQYRNARQLVHTNNPVSSCKYCSMHGGNSAGDASFFRMFITQNHLSDLDISAGDIELEGATSGAQGITIAGRGSFRVSPEGAAFFLLTIVPDRGLHHGEIVLDGRKTVFFDTSDQHLLVALPLEQGRKTRLEISVRSVLDEAPGQLLITKVSRLGHTFRAKSALDTRRVVMRSEHREFIAGLRQRLGHWAASQPEGRRSFGVFGTYDIGEVFASEAEALGLEFSGYFDHFPGNFHKHYIRAVSGIDPEKTQALVYTSPYRSNGVLEHLREMLSQRGIALLSVEEPTGCSGNAMHLS